MGGGEAHKKNELGNESGKESGKSEVKDIPVSEGYRNHPILLRDLLEEGVNEADQEGEEQ